MINYCIPTVRLYSMVVDLVKSIRAGSKQPDKITIIDNGSSSQPDKSLHSLLQGLSGSNVELVLPTSCWSCAKSWNYFIDTSAPEDLIIISNDDLTVHKGTIEAFVEASKTSDLDMLWNGGDPESENSQPYSLFAIRKPVVEQVGYFDESYIMTYYEDVDFDNRLALAGKKRGRVDMAKMRHYGSQTLHSTHSLKLSSVSNKIHHNAAFYQKKWGNLPPDAPIYTSPFNNNGLAAVHTGVYNYDIVTIK